MQINQVSQLLQPKTNETKSNTTSGNNSFELMLQEMIENIKNKDMINNTESINTVNNTALTNNIGSSDKITNGSKAINGLDSLSLNPQKLAQMLDIMQMSSKANAITSFGDDENSDSEDATGSLDTLDTSNSTNMSDGITGLLQKVLNNSSSQKPSYIDTTS